MKHTILIFCLLASITATAQKYDYKAAFKKAIPGSILSFTGGTAGGLREGLLFRKNEFFRAFPNANRNYWDRDISWQNPKFMGAAWDGYHHAQYLHLAATYTGGAFAGINIAAPYHKGQKRKFGHKVLDVLIHAGAGFVAYNLGAVLVYDVILHR
jgi:hypothetical protein